MCALAVNSSQEFLSADSGDQRDHESREFFSLVSSVSETQMLGGAPCSFHGEKFSAAVALLVDVGGLEMTHTL